MSHGFEVRVATDRTMLDDRAHRGRADHYRPFASQALERLPLKRDSWFLEIGCGVGYAVCWAARAAPDGRSVGLDPSEAMIARARQCCVGLPNADFHVAHFPELHTLPYDRFAVIFSMSAFPFFPDLRAALIETRRLLEPGGTFACLVDCYGENVASRHLDEDLGIPPHLLDTAGWREAFALAGFVDLRQDRLRLAPDDAPDSWATTEGSLLTLGRRA